MPAGRLKRRRAPSAGTPPGARRHREESPPPPPTGEQRTRDDGKAHDEHNNNDNADDNNGSNARVAAASDGSKVAVAVAEHFSAVEIYIQLAGQRNRGDFILPRDVGDLLLWSVPAAVPLIEGPRVFFLKNKSRLRDVVVIYVNGWTHDEMALAGVGDPAADDGISSEGAKQPTREQPPRQDETGMRAQHGHGWAERIGRAMLAPVRAQQCWARKECGVQFAPMLLPDEKSSLAREIFWRNSPPKVPRDGQRRGCPASNTTNAEAEGGEKGEASHGCGVTDVDKLTSAVPDASAHGVGKLFNRALVIHGRATASAPADNVAPPSSLAAASSSVASESTAMPQPGDADASLWEDRATLLQHALSLEKDRAVLESLAYVVDLPSDCGEAAEWASFDAPLPPEDEGGGVQPPRVFAMDCEMVLVENNVSALARLTLLDVRAGAVVLDTLVKPPTKVMDYVTRYSGVDEAMLDGVTTTLHDCQRELKRHIDTEAFVVGHSLENDFKACKMLPNCYVLDTAHLFPHPAGLPFKNALRFLAMRYLRKKIQQGSHDSAEDASTSAELVHLKLRHGPEFGVRARVSILQLMESAAAAKEGVAGEPAARDEGPSEQSAPSPPASSSPASALGVELNLFDDACALRDIIPGGADARAGSLLHTVPVRHDRDAMRKTVRCLQQRQRDRQGAVDGVPSSYAMTWVQFTETVEPRRKQKDTEEEEEEGGEKKEGEEQQQPWERLQLERVDETNRRVMQIIRAAPHNSLVVVLAGGGSAHSERTSSDKSRGVCFAFVKDENSPGPPAAWLDAEPQATVPLASSAGADVRHDGTLGTPPACQPQ